MKSGDLLFWIWLSEALGAGSRSFGRLIGLYENPYDLFHADETELDRIPRLSAAARRALADKELSRASAILDRCEQSGIGILSYGDDAYPVALREIDAPPAVLYYRGALPDWNRRLCIGMVGTRRMSAYGLRSAYKIAYELSAMNAIVVSGMAAGIDGVSAAASLRAGGTTVAVLGCGVDVVYPRHHAPLAQKIATHGLLLSEYPPGIRPGSYHFPVRNRIISGLSQATVVVEAGIKSGSLITAKNAVLQGRDVFALPANVGSAGAEGTNGLLRDGAKLALKATDIIAPYAYIYAETLHPERATSGASDAEADPAYLAELGVIEWEGKPRTLAPPAEPSKAPPRKRPVAERQTARPEPPKEPPRSEGKTSDARTPDEILSSLSPVQAALLGAIPDDTAIAADSLCNLGYPYGETIAALTMLEIMGLIQKLPGAMYKKA